MTARPVAIPRPRPHLRVVQGRAARAPRLAPWALFTTLVLLAFFGLIFSRIALDRSAFVLEELEDQIALEAVRYQGLRLEVARLQSPQRVLQQAEEMGLVFPAEVRTLSVPAAVATGENPGGRWAEVKSVLGALP
ncbi:MAG: hypothetical protein ACRDXD_00840 [Acidimicrobiia bacterium]